MTLLPSLGGYFAIAASFALIVALAILWLIWRLATRTEYQKTNFFCRFFGFSIETRMKLPRPPKR